MTEEVIQIARELNALSAMPGWAHIEKIMAGMIESENVGPKELANLNPNVIAYKIGLKDGIIKLKNAIRLNIQMGEQKIKTILSDKQKDAKKIQDMQDMAHQYGYQ